MAVMSPIEFDAGGAEYCFGRGISDAAGGPFPEDVGWVIRMS